MLNKPESGIPAEDAFEYEYPSEEELDTEQAHKLIVPLEPGAAERRRQIQEAAEQEEESRYKPTLQERRNASGLIPPGALNHPQDLLPKK